VPVLSIAAQTGSVTDHLSFTDKLPVGTYTVIARAIGFAASVRSGVQMHAGKTATLEFWLTAVPVRLRGSEITGTRNVALIAAASSSSSGALQLRMKRSVTGEPGDSWEARLRRMR